MGGDENSELNPTCAHVHVHVMYIHVHTCTCAHVHVHVMYIHVHTCTCDYVRTCMYSTQSTGMATIKIILSLSCFGKFLTHFQMNSRKNSSVSQ